MMNGADILGPFLAPLSTHLCKIIWNLERYTLHLRIKNENDRSFLAYMINEYEFNKLKKAEQ